MELSRQSEHLGAEVARFLATVRTPRHAEGADATYLGHDLLDPEVVALDALLMMLGHVLERFRIGSTVLRWKPRVFEFQAAFPDGFERQVYDRFADVSVCTMDFVVMILPLVVHGRGTG